jgi:hypothetical protein
MHRKSIKFRSILQLAVLMLGPSLGGYGQNAPQVQQILDRLDQLEKDNQALLEEVRALRQQVAGLRTPSPDATPSQTQAQNPSQNPSPNSDERQAVQENRIDELAQTKVEASQKFPIRITGMALFNASVNGRFNGDAENPLVASSTPGDMTGDHAAAKHVRSSVQRTPNLLEWQDQRFGICGFLCGRYNVARSRGAPSYSGHEY